MIRKSQFAISAATFCGVLIAANPQTVAAGASHGAVLLAQAPPGAAQPQSVEANIATLRQRLQIMPAQEGQFNAVANVMRENARAEAGAPQQPPPGSTAVDDLRAYIRYSEIELAGLKKMLPALDALYATLSPGQKRTADAIFREGPGG